MASLLFLGGRFNQLTPRVRAIVSSVPWLRKLRPERQLEPPWNMQTLLHRCVSNGWGRAHRCQQPLRLPSHEYKSRGQSVRLDRLVEATLLSVRLGYRCIAHARRCHGRSSQPWNGNDMDTYADDLAELAEKLDLKGAVHVGHSTGGGEGARYMGGHG